jgi:hypothetical protein
MPAKKYKTEEERRLAKNAAQARYVAKNPEKRKATTAKHYAKNREKEIARKTKYYAENSEKKNAISIKYQAGKKETSPSVIYQIFCEPTNTFYVGQTSYWAEKRWTDHKSELKHKKHHVRALQDDYNEYGLEAFEFSVLKELDPQAPKEELLKEESNYIQTLLTEGKELYNKEGTP